jgi:hypothetical protein
VALRPWLLPGLPLSNVTNFYAPITESRQFWLVLSRCRYWGGGITQTTRKTIFLQADNAHKLPFRVFNEFPNAAPVEAIEALLPVPADDETCRYCDGYRRPPIAVRSS